MLLVSSRWLIVMINNVRNMRFSICVWADFYEVNVNKSVSMIEPVFSFFSRSLSLSFAYDRNWNEFQYAFVFLLFFSRMIRQPPQSCRNKLMNRCPNTFELLEMRWKEHMLPFFSQTKNLSSVTTRDMNNWRDKCRLDKPTPKKSINVYSKWFSVIQNSNSKQSKPMPCSHRFTCQLNREKSQPLMTF